jgi:hypothetical protein
MNVFNILTIIVSVTIFLGLFIYTFVIYYNNNPTIFPKDMTACPDFWTVNPDGTCQIPTSAPGDIAVNAGKLTDSQSSKYTIYTYPTVSPDTTGKLLDRTLDISNISYLEKYDDPGTKQSLTRNKKAYIPERNIRNKSIKNGTTPTKTIYRYDISNNIPYGYSIRNPGSIDFRDKGWATYGDPYCSIKAWTKENGIAWDGMLAYNKC